MVKSGEDDKKENLPNSNKLKNHLKLPLILIIIVLSIAISLSILFFGLYLLFGLDAPFFKVVSDSMIPTLQVNDTIIIRHIPFSNVKVGDIIVFYSPYNSSQVIVHRVIDRFEISNTTTTKPQIIIRTQGDVNNFSIFGVDYPIREHNYIGKVVYHISYTEPLFHILKPPVIQLIILAALSLIVGTILYTKVFNRILQKRKGGNNID